MFPCIAHDEPQLIVPFFNRPQIVIFDAKKYEIKKPKRKPQSQKLEKHANTICSVFQEHTGQSCLSLNSPYSQASF